MITSQQRNILKGEFRQRLAEFTDTLVAHVASDRNQWTIKGFIDTFSNIYTLSADTKIVSKILEIHIFPQILRFAAEHSYRIVLADHQNYYPDLSFVSITDDSIKFAVDFKTTYRLPQNSRFCNGFTLGSHGEYFSNRTSRKNIQFPYHEYLAHFCLGIIYSRAAADDVGNTRVYPLEQLSSVVSVIKDFQFFVCEKWEIASNRSGSGNTANIGSITCIEDILAGNGMFRQLGEEVFDDYWMNYGKITILNAEGRERKITTLKEFLEYKGLDATLITVRTGKTLSKRQIAQD